MMHFFFQVGKRSVVSVLKRLTVSKSVLPPVRSLSKLSATPGTAPAPRERGRGR